MSLEAIISYAKDDYESVKDRELVSIEAEILLAIQTIRATWNRPVIPTQSITNAFNLEREASERYKSMSIGRVMERLGFRHKRTHDGRNGWLVDTNTLSRLLKRYCIEDTAKQVKL